MIAFNKYYNKFNILSVSLVVISLVLLIFIGLNFGIDSFGKSAPYKDIYKNFELNSESIIKKIKKEIWK